MTVLAAPTIQGEREFSNAFWERVLPHESGCWHWVGPITKKGYPSWRGKHAHRQAWILAGGELLAGQVVDHLCHNLDPHCVGICLHRRCVRPDHLEATTQRNNLLRGKTLAAANHNKTHCVSGHPFDGANTYWRSETRRQCKACVARRIRHRRAEARS